VDPTEIIRAATELEKVVVPAAAAIPFTGIAKRILGPAADELAEMWRDQVRLYRWERQVKCVEKAEKMAKDAGFTPKAVPPKILFPLLDGASMEDNDELHTMWAALLANASSQAGKVVRPSFISLLREMAPDEAQFLKSLHARNSRLGEIENDCVRQLNSLPSLSFPVEPDPGEGEEGTAAYKAGVVAYQERDKQESKIKDWARAKEESTIDAFWEEVAIVENEDRNTRVARCQACMAILKDAGLVEDSDDFLRRPVAVLSPRGLIFLGSCTPPSPSPTPNAAP
jgi:Abortive infection alpha